MILELQTKVKIMKKLDKRVILISGASQGLGEAAAYAYAAEGATVILLGRNKKRLENVYDTIVAQGGPEPFAVSFDLYTATEKEFDALAVSLLKETGRIDGILHCAAYLYALSPVLYQTVQEWADQYRINTIAPMALTRAFLPALIEAPSASVVFVSEAHSTAAKAYWGGFGASKAALNYLAQVCADEWSDQYPNLRANVVIPGSINSPQRKKSHPGESDSERRPIAEVVPQLVYWMSDDSRGRSGEIVCL